MKILSFDVGIKNLGYCIIDENFKIFHWGIINIIENTKKKIETDALCELLWDNLDSKPELTNVDKVVIENQPSLKNPKMKTIQILLLSYFVSKKRNITTNINKIDCFLPRNKLNIYNGENKQQIMDSITCKSKYTRTKKLSIEFTREMIKDQDDWLNYLNKEKKKDDLADSFIQGACYINRFIKKIK
jgi:hypothetical protein